VTVPRHRRSWIPVEDPSVFRRGDMVLLQTARGAARYEVLAGGRREILVRRMSWWQVLLRRWRGRLRRWWTRPHAHR
jgi:hypothetical protein